MDAQSERVQGLGARRMGDQSIRVQLTSGLLVTVSQNRDSQNTGPSSFQPPHVVAGKSVQSAWEERNLNQWFDTTAFVRSKCDGCAGEGIFMGPLGYGNAGTSLFDGPSSKTWDFACFKEFRPKEGHRVQFRYEAFNFLNTPQFSAPSRALGAADFGRINETAINDREMATRAEIYPLTPGGAVARRIQMMARPPEGPST